MLVAYIDESYDVVPPTVGYYMVAVVVHEDALDDLWTDMLAVVPRIVPTLPATTEIHASDMFAGEDHWRINPGDRIEIHREGLRVTAQYAETIFVVSSIPHNRSRPPNVTRARMDVLEALVPQIERYARARHQKIVLVADEEERTARAVVSMLHNGRHLAGGVLRTPILETVMFAKSHASPGVWGADLIAFGERRLAMGYPSDNSGKRRTIARYRDLYDHKRQAGVHLGAIPPNP